MEKKNALEQLLDNDRVLPVVVLDEPEKTIPLARLYEESGIGVIEVTLRTEGAQGAARDVAQSFPTLRVGVGTVVQLEQLDEAVRCGMRFAVSPAFSPNMVEDTNALDMLYLPGVSTLSEVMQARSMGLRYLKFYPAKLSGGPDLLSQIAGMFSDMAFCPTGGFDQDKLNDYLALPNVFCVSGTWLAAR